MRIQRDVYLKRLINRKQNGFVKVITGIRRCGKSYLLNNIFYDYLIESGVRDDHIIRFAFDSAKDLIKIAEDPLSLQKGDRCVDPRKFLSYINKQITDSDSYYLLLDEVQLLGAFESVLNSFLREDNLDVYVTGSNSRFLSSDILTEFAGRGDEIHMLPLSFSEFSNVYPGSKEDALESYMIYGGLPATVVMELDEQKNNYLIAQLDNLYLKDVIQRNHLKSDTKIGEVLSVLASGISGLINPSKLSKTFTSVLQKNISQETIGQYINFLQDAFLIKKVERYDIKGKKYISTPFKVYFEDIGLRNARLNFRQYEKSHIMENIIYNELRYRGYQIDVGVVTFNEKNKDGKQKRVQYEIDFVVNAGSKRYYIQSAYSIPDEEKYIQETNGFKKINDSFKKIILVEETMKPRYNESGYLMMGLKEFLLDDRSLEF